jgi:N-acetylmuramoyl-L-alanine amidase-like protein
MSKTLICYCLAALLCYAATTCAAPAAKPAADITKAPAGPKQEKVDLAALADKPLYKFSEAEVDAYLKQLQSEEPDLRKRIVKLARKNIGQPYEIYLLGEMPFETYDPQPIYCLGKSDCVVFAEHTYAMALTGNWPDFIKMLQRIRYRDGQMGVATRNHYTEADWDISNRWLVRDITADVAGVRAGQFNETIDRQKFLKSRYGLAATIPVQHHHDIYIPYADIDRAKPQLQDGDFVNVVRATVKPGTPPERISGGEAFVGHVGLISHGDDGTVHMIHSSEPAVREEPIDNYIARATKDLGKKDEEGKPRLIGFKFFRLEEQPIENLKKIDGDAAPRVNLPLDDPSDFWRKRLQ